MTPPHLADRGESARRSSLARTAQVPLFPTLSNKPEQGLPRARDKVEQATGTLICNCNGAQDTIFRPNSELGIRPALPSIVGKRLFTSHFGKTLVS